MTSRSDLSQRAAQALATAGAPAPPSASEEVRAVAVVAAAIRARRHRLRRQRWMLGGAAAAAALVLGVGAAKWQAIHNKPQPSARAPAAFQPKEAAPLLGIVDAVQGDAYLLHGGRSDPPMNGSTVGAGDQLVVQRSARVAFSLPTGTRVSVEDGGDLTVVAQGTTELFRIAAGSMRADVKKLSNGERFIVRTTDAEIEVKGTSFRVSSVPSDPSCGAGTTTRLSVYEGVVAVRAGAVEASVSAGQAWPPDCNVAGTSAVTALAPPRASVRTATSEAVTAPSSSAAVRSQLAEQNDLYARAIAAREGGDVGAALQTFDQLAAKYPSSPLAETAVAERMKLLLSTNPRRAVDAARDYLARYPAGFARADAEIILAREVGGH